jgi:hypothetical protein
VKKELEINAKAHRNTFEEEAWVGIDSLVEQNKSKLAL